MLPKFNRRQWSTLAIIGLADFANAICVSLQAPFFPQEVCFFISLIFIHKLTKILNRMNSKIDTHLYTCVT